MRFRFSAVISPLRVVWRLFDAPTVVLWFRLYSLALTWILLAHVYFTRGVGLLHGAYAGFDLAMVVCLVALALVYGGAHAVAFFLPPRPWVWYYDLVLLGVGVPPISIALIAAWTRPETRQFFGLAGVDADEDADELCADFVEWSPPPPLAPTIGKAS